MKKLRIVGRDINGKTFYVIQKRISLFFFAFWIDVDEELNINAKKPKLYEDKLEAKNCIKFS